MIKFLDYRCLYMLLDSISILSWTTFLSLGILQGQITSVLPRTKSEYKFTHLAQLTGVGCSAK